MGDVDSTSITEEMRTFHAQDVAEQAAWKLHSPMWRMELDIARLRSRDASKQWRVYVDFSHACSDRTCRLLNNVHGKTYNDDRVVFVIEVSGL